MAVNLVEVWAIIKCQGHHVNQIVLKREAWSYIIILYLFHYMARVFYKDGCFLLLCFSFGMSESQRCVTSQSVGVHVHVHVIQLWNSKHWCVLSTAILYNSMSTDSISGSFVVTLELQYNIKPSAQCVYIYTLIVCGVVFLYCLDIAVKLPVKRTLSHFRGELSIVYHVVVKHFFCCNIIQMMEHHSKPSCLYSWILWLLAPKMQDLTALWDYSRFCPKTSMTKWFACNTTGRVGSHPTEQTALPGGSMLYTTHVITG